MFQTWFFFFLIMSMDFLSLTIQRRQANVWRVPNCQWDHQDSCTSHERVIQIWYAIHANFLPRDLWLVGSCTFDQGCDRWPKDQHVQINFRVVRSSIIIKLKKEMEIRKRKGRTKANFGSISSQWLCSLLVYKYMGPFFVVIVPSIQKRNVTLNMGNIKKKSN